MTAPGSAFAQRYHIHTYYESDGLPSSHVTSACQDRLGRMWFATRSGLVLYDGFSWDRVELPEGDPDPIIRWVAADSAGTVWAVSDRIPLQVFQFHGGDWSALPLAGGRELRGATGALLQGETAGVPHLFVGTHSGAVMEWTGTAWREIRFQSGGASPCWDLLTFRGAVYAATGDGLYTLDLPTGVGTRILDGVLPAAGVHSIAADPDGHTLWITGRNWVGTLRDGVFHRVGADIPFSFTSTYPSTVSLADGLGGLYAGNSIQLLRVQLDGSVEHLTRRSGLTTEGATALFRDREGNIWVCAERGVAKIVSTRFSNYTEESGLLEDEVTAVYERSNGDFVLGHPRGITVMSDTVRWTAATGPTFIGRILDICEDRNGTLWLAANERGLLELRPDRSMKWHHTQRGVAGVMSVAMDDSGTLWVADGWLLQRRRGKTFERIPLPAVFEPAHGMYMRRLIRGGDGHVYVASHGPGLMRVEADSVTLCAAKPGGEIANIYAFCDAGPGGQQVGASDGLYRVSGDRLVRSEEPRIERPIYFIVRDRADRFWYGTDNGVMVWNGTRLDHLTVEDGLAGRETNRGAGVLDSRGRLWIGTVQGLSVFDPTRERRVDVAPTLELLGVDTAHGSRSLAAPLTLSHEDNDLVFHFHAVSFVDEKRIRYRARLDGFESEWTELSTPADRRVRYTNLPAGRYQLFLQATNGARWSSVSQSSIITIRPALWQEPLFYTSVVLLVLCLVWFASRYVAQHRHARRLERQVLLRVEELQSVERELTRRQRMESLGVLAGGIAHDFNNLLTVILGNLSLIENEPLNDESRQSVSDATSATLRARSLTQQLLTFSQGGAPVRKTASIAEVIRESIVFIMRGRNTRCDVSLADDLWLVEIDADQMNQVINNILLNAAQSMPDGGVIHVTAANVTDPGPPLVRGQYVRIAVRDSGIGIPSHRLPHVFDPYFTTKPAGTGLGLATAYSVVKRHEGHLQISSRENVGTTVTVCLPASVGHRAATVPVARESGGIPVRARVLVMDDDPAVCAVIGAALRRHHHAVVVTTDGREAVECYRENMRAGHRFDAVILDLTVPGGMGGKETLAQLKAMDTEVCAIVASGYSNDPVIADYGEHGFRGRVIKPFMPGDLARALAGALRSS